MNFQSMLHDFITLWVVIDPIGTIPVFLAVTSGRSTAQRNGIAVRAVLVAAIVLVIFIVGGQVLLEALGISLVSFQIAGSIVLLLFALSMIFGDSKPESEIRHAETDLMQSAIFPVAIPSLASPGAMLAVVLLTDNNRFSVESQIITTTLMLIVLIVALALLLLAIPIHKVIGKSGEILISRIMGMILAAVAVDAFLSACVQLGWIAPSILAAGM